MKPLLPPEPPPSLVAYELEPGKVLFTYTLSFPEVDGLTVAERDVLTLLLNGCDVATIATTRNRSPRTVANQLARIYAKLGVRSRAELAAKIMGASER